MNTEAQRARNKRKRDKLREKRRLTREVVLRFRLDAEAFELPHKCGLLAGESPVSGDPEWANCCYAYDHEPEQAWSISEFTTEWIYMGTHDLSSSAVDAITCFINTLRFCIVKRIVLIVQDGGLTRRKVWRGHTIGVADVERQVCSYVKRPFSGE